MSEVREFLDLYNELERLLRSKYQYDDRRYSSLIIRFEHEPEGERFREKLELCRETRNLLSHNPLIEGEELVTPSPRLTEVLREVIETIKDPPTAKKICTPVSALLLCTGREKAADVIRTMLEKGYSHVPILENGVLEGVFSAEALLSILGEGSHTLGADSLIGDFSEFLSPDSRRTVTYGFAAPDTPYYDLKNEFELGGPKKARVAAIFVTSNGAKNGKVIGMITPWDVIRAFPE